MKDKEREQLEKFVAHQMLDASTRLDEAIDALLRKQNLSGMLKSGNTIAWSIKEIAATGEAVIAELVAEAGRLGKDSDSYLKIECALADYIDRSHSRMAEILSRIGLADDAIRSVARGQLEKACDLLRAALTVQRYYFDERGTASAKSTARSLPAFSEALAEREYLSRVVAIGEGRSSEADDIAFMQGRMRIGRPAVRSLRAKHAPERWKESGRPKKDKPPR